MAERFSQLSLPPKWVKEDLDKFAEDYLREKITDRQNSGANPIRLSSAGYCQRKLWYRNFMPETSLGLEARAMANFELGDTIEQRVRFWLGRIYGEKYRGFKLVCENCKADRRVYTPKCPTCGSGDFREYEDIVEFPVPMTDGSTVMVRGHIDGLLDCPDGMTRIVEIKSAANFTFFRAKPTLDKLGSLSYDYACQNTAYLHGMNLTETIFYYVRKETADIGPGLYIKEEGLVAEIQARFRKVLESDSQHPLPRDYPPVPYKGTHGKPTKAEEGLLVLGYPCSYCEFRQACYGTLNGRPWFQREFVSKKDYASGAIKKEPVMLDRSRRFSDPRTAQEAESE